VQAEHIYLQGDSADEPSNVQHLETGIHGPLWRFFLMATFGLAMTAYLYWILEVL
jgi:hypothetical protein